VKSSGIPDKITLKTLEAWGFKGSNDRPLLTILKFIGFVDSAGVPTQTWSEFRSTKSGPAVLAQAIRSSYSSLFQLYADAHQKDNEALRNFFSTHTNVGADTLNYIVRTFKVLCENANFEAEPTKLSSKSVQHAIRTAEGASRTVTEQGPSGFTINVNIQLTLPATDNPDIYDNLFAAMKKHILS
jgi:hypothetical protein